MAMVGQYQGPDDTAALAVVAPIWNIIYSLGLLTGTGGSVLFSAQRGGHQESGSENQYFTAAVSGSVLLAALAWVGLLLFQGTLLTFFGADESLLPLAEIYMKPIRYVFPLFLFNQLLAAFLRNDGAPGLATLGVLAGGVLILILPSLLGGGEPVAGHAHRRGADGPLCCLRHGALYPSAVPVKTGIAAPPVKSVER